MKSMKTFGSQNHPYVQYLRWVIPARPVSWVIILPSHLVDSLALGNHLSIIIRPCVLDNDEKPSTDETILCSEAALTSMQLVLFVLFSFSHFDSRAALLPCPNVARDDPRVICSHLHNFSATSALRILFWCDWWGLDQANLGLKPGFPKMLDKTLHAFRLVIDVSTCIWLLLLAAFHCELVYQTLHCIVCIYIRSKLSHCWRFTHFVPWSRNCRLNLGFGPLGWWHLDSDSSQIKSFVNCRTHFWPQWLPFQSPGICFVLFGWLCDPESLKISE